MAMRRKHSFGAQFDERRTKDGRGDMTVFLANFTSLPAKAGSTHFDDLLAVAEDSKRTPNKSFQIKYIHPSLQTTKFPRGVTYFAKSSEVIEGILRNYPDLCWWMEADGLVVNKARPNLDALSHFDQIVGPMSIRLQQKGRLSKEAVSSIAQKLDAEGFRLKEQLQPREWDEIVGKNRKRTGNLIKSFSSAARDPRFIRAVRRTIYRARNRYKKAAPLESQFL